jgi:periplasmic protein TonB
MAFEAILAQQTKPQSRRKRAMLTLSLAVHACALMVGIVHSLWRVDELPMPAVHVTLTTAAPPPPPPPPPAGRKSSEVKPKKKPIEPKPNVIVEPKKAPVEPEPESAEDSEAEPEQGGQVGGVAGGVAGGVVGGVVGSPPPPPPPKNDGPKLVSAQVARGQLLIDPNAEQYRVKLPGMLARTGATYFAVVRVCVSAQGAVTGVQVVKPAAPAIDPQIPAVLGRWRYRPLALDGRPTAFCYMLRYEISAR